MKRFLLKALAALTVLAIVGVFAVPAWLARGSERVAQEVASRLSDALGAECQVGKARILSRREVVLEAVGCVFDDGQLIGFGVGRAFAEFSAPPLSRPLPPVAYVEVDDLQLRLRQTPDVQAEVDNTAEEDSSSTLERELLRFLDFTDALNRGSGGGSVPALRSRLTDAGVVKVERATIDSADGTPLLSDVHAMVEREGDRLAIAVAAELGTGGMVALDGKLSQDGFADARIHVERLPVADHLGRLGGESLAARAGQVSGDLRFEAGTWSTDLSLEGVVVRADAVGREWLPLPTVRVLASLVPDTEAATLAVQGGEWRIAGVGGELEGSVGPVPGPDAQVQLSVESERMRLGELLGALPESLMPASWAEEIQGTIDLSIAFGGPLHNRKEWDLDWDADFSRLLLASGSLARDVARLGRPFEHSFPADHAGQPFTRVIGADEDAFVPIGAVSPHLIAAVVSTEDSGFFAHSGFEESSIREAVLENLRDGEGRGGSTITQQLAKNLFLSGERTFARKLKEAVIAWRLESDLPKKRILEIYLNIAEWGPGLYGARDAADHYFARTPRVLRPEEAAFLASMLPSPRRYHGYYHGGRGLTDNRYSMVQDILRSMHRMGRLNAVNYHLARGEPVELRPCSLPHGG